MPDSRIVMIKESGDEEPSGTEEDAEESLEDLEKTILSLCSGIEQRAHTLQTGRPTQSHFLRDRSEAQDEDCFPCTLSPINRQQQEVAVVTPINHSWIGQTQSTPHTDMPHCPPYSRRGLVYPSGPDLQVAVQEADTFPGSSVYDDGMTYDELLSEVSRISGKSLPSNCEKNQQQLSKLHIGEIIAASENKHAPNSPQPSVMEDIHNEKYFAQPSVASEVSVAGRFTGIQKSRHAFDESSIDQELAPSADILGLEKFVCSDMDDDEEDDEEKGNRTMTTRNQIHPGKENSNQMTVGSSAADCDSSSKSELQSGRKPEEVSFGALINIPVTDCMVSSNGNIQSLKEPGELSSTTSEKESESDTQISPVKTTVQKQRVRKRKLSKVRESDKEEGECSTTTDDTETDGNHSTDADDGEEQEVTLIEKTMTEQKALGKEESTTSLYQYVEKGESAPEQFVSDIPAADDGIVDCEKDGTAGSGETAAACHNKAVAVSSDCPSVVPIGGSSTAFTDHQSGVGYPLPRDADFDCTNVDAMEVASDVSSHLSRDAVSNVGGNDHDDVASDSSGEVVMSISSDSVTLGASPMSEQGDADFITLSETASDDPAAADKSRSPRSMTDHDNVSVKSRSPHSATDSDEVSVKSRSPQSLTDSDGMLVESRSPHSVTDSDDVSVKSGSPHSVTDTDGMSFKTGSPHSVTDSDGMSFKSRSPHSVIDSDDVSVKSKSPQSVTDNDGMSFKSRSPQSATDSDDVSVKSRSPQSLTDHDVSVKSKPPQSATDSDDVSVKSRSPRSMTDHDIVSVKSRSPHSMIDSDDVSLKSKSPQPVTDNDGMSVKSRSPQSLTDHDASVKSRSPQSATDSDDVSVKSRSPQSATDRDDESVKSRSPQSETDRDDVSEQSNSKDSSAYDNNHFVLSLTEDEDDVDRVLLGCSDKLPLKFSSKVEGTNKCLQKLNDDCELAHSKSPLIAESFVVIDSPVKTREESFLIIDDPLQGKYRTKSISFVTGNTSVIGNGCKAENIWDKPDYDTSNDKFVLIENVLPHTKSGLLSSGLRSNRDKGTVCAENKVSMTSGGKKTVAEQPETSRIKSADMPVVKTISPVVAPKKTDCAAVNTQNNVCAKEKKTLKVEHETRLMKSVREKWSSGGIQRPDENLTHSSWLRNKEMRRKMKAMYYLEGNCRMPPLLRENTTRNKENADDTCNSPKLKKRRTSSSPHGGGANTIMSDLQRDLSLIEKEQNNLAWMLSQQHEIRIGNMKQQHAQYYQAVRTKQIIEKRQFYNTRGGFVTPVYLEYQLMLFDKEHAAQVQQLEEINRHEMNKLVAILDEEKRVQAERFEILKEPKRQMLKTFTLQSRASRAQMETAAPHATVELWKGPCKSNQRQKSLVQVCLPTDIATFMIREDEIYDAHYVY